MTDINCVTIVGRLTKDCEVRHTESGSQIIKMSLASTYSKKVGNEWQEDVNYFDVRLIASAQSRQANYLTKGKQVCVSGCLRQERWEKDGQRRSTTGIYASQVQILSQGDKQGAQTVHYVPSASQVLSDYNAATPSAPVGPEVFDDDSIPF